MVRHLLRNVYQFSVAKNHSQLKALTEALVTSKGEISTFTQVREVARKIDERYNITYLQTEYDTAISSAQMAAHWTRFGEGKADPMLRYVTAGDERVRASHAALNGLQRPMSDPIWDTIYPPNGWHCRCTVVEVNGKPTPNGDLRLPNDVPPLFRTNLAKTGMLFPKGHPYFEGLTPKDFGDAIKHVQSKDIYLTVHTEAGNSIEISCLHNDTEIVKNVEVVDTLLNNKVFSNARLLPDIHQADIKVKEKLYPKGELPPDPRKNADAILDGHVYEFKTTIAKNMINNINKAARQARRVVIRLTSLGTQKEHTTRYNIRQAIIDNDLKEVVLIWPDGTVERFE